jgi:hypothetical protein
MTEAGVPPRQEATTERVLAPFGGTRLILPALAVAGCVRVSPLASLSGPRRSDDGHAEANIRRKTASGSLLHFPPTPCVGNFYGEVETGSSWDPERVCLEYNWEYVAPARGDVLVPGEPDPSVVSKPDPSATCVAIQRL